MLLQVFDGLARHIPALLVGQPTPPRKVFLSGAASPPPTREGYQDNDDRQPNQHIETSVAALVVHTDIPR